MQPTRNTNPSAFGCVRFCFVFPLQISNPSASMVMTLLIVLRQETKGSNPFLWYYSFEYSSRCLVIKVDVYQVDKFLANELCENRIWSLLYVVSSTWFFL